MDKDTADRVNAVARDVMSAFRHTVELYGHTPALIEAAGFESFEDWARAQPKPQITRGERREMALALQAVGKTTREIAAVTGTNHATIARDLVANATDAPVVHEGDEPASVANATDIAQARLPIVTEGQTPAVDPEDEPEPSGGPQWDALQDIRNRISALAAIPPKAVAAQVPARRRAATARELRRLGTTLARVVLALEA